MCGEQGVCPDGTSCATDGFCHSPEQSLANCSPPDSGLPDARPGDPDSSVDIPDADISPDACAETSFAGVNTSSLLIPDFDLVGITTTIDATTSCVVVTSVQIRVNVTHTFSGDVSIELTSPAGATVLVKEADILDSTDDIHAAFDVDIAAGESASGPWQLTLADNFSSFVGTQDSWSIGINQPAP